MDLDQRSSSDESCSNDGIALAEGLSADTLAALLKFVNCSNKDTEDRIDENECDIHVMAHKIEDSLDPKKPDPKRELISELSITEPINAVEVLRRDGVVRLAGILRPELCDMCLEDVNINLQLAVDSGVDHYCEGIETGFGNVDSKGNRWDMYLKDTGSFKEAFSNIFDKKKSPLPQLFHTLLEGMDANMYEYAVLVSDKGALTQRIHSDTTYQDVCPLYTVFIALQDVTCEMGPTVFIPGSNVCDTHRDFRLRKHQWLAEASYSQALLKKGDVAIMDSRTFHCGSENTAGRRALMYFTLLNPCTSNMGGGSLFSDMRDLSMFELMSRSTRQQAATATATATGPEEIKK